MSTLLNDLWFVLFLLAYAVDIGATYLVSKKISPDNPATFWYDELLYVFEGATFYILTLMLTRRSYVVIPVGYIIAGQIAIVTRMIMNAVLGGSSKKYAASIGWGWQALVSVTNGLYY